MYSLTSAQLAIFWFPSYQHVTMTFTDGQGNTRTITQADILQNSFALNRASSSSSNIQLGAAICAELSFTLNNASGQWDNNDLLGKELYVSVTACSDWGNQTSANTVIVPLGYFIIDEAPKTATTISVVAYDRMIKLDRPATGIATAGYLHNHTGAWLIGQICTLCGLTYTAPSTSNRPANYTNYLAEPDNWAELCTENTYRRVLMWTLERMGCSAYMDYQGTLRLGQYTDTAPANAVTLTIANRKSSDLAEEDITITGISANVSKSTYVAGTDTYRLTIDQNPFFTDANAQTLINNINTKIGGYHYRPFTAETLPTPNLEACDFIYFNEADNTSHISLVMNCTYRLNGATSLSSTGDNTVAQGYAAVNSLTRAEQAALEKMRKATNEQMSNIEIDALHMNELAANTLGWFSTEEELADGSKIIYWHDRPTLAGSTIIYKQGASGFFLSQDGGVTYTNGFDTSGNAVLNILSAIGVNADWVRTGELRDRVGANYWNLNDGTISISVRGNIDSITTYYAETEDNVAPPWDAPKAYLLASNGDPLYDADGKRLIAKSAWRTDLDITTPSSLYRWQRQHIVYTNGSDELTAPVPLQDYYGRANLVMEMSEDQTGNPIGVISALADYILFTAGQLEIHSPQFTLDREGNAVFSGDVSAKSLTLGSNSAAGAFRLLSPDGFTDVNLSGDGNGSYISVTDTTSFARSTLRGKAGSVILSLSSDNGATYDEVGSLWVNASPTATLKSRANFDAYQVGKYQAATGDLGNNQYVATWDYTNSLATISGNVYRLRKPDGSNTYNFAEWDATQSTPGSHLKSPYITATTRLRVNAISDTTADEIFMYRASSGHNVLRAFTFQAGVEGNNATAITWDDTNSVVEFRGSNFKIRNGSTLYTVLSWDSSLAATKLSTSYAYVDNVFASANVKGGYMVYSPHLCLTDGTNTWNTLIYNAATARTEFKVDYATIGSLYLNDTTAVGTVQESTGSTTTLANSTATNVASVSLTKGKWLVTAQFNMPVATADTGRVYVSISTASATLAYPAYTNVAVNGASQAAYATNLSRIVEVTGSSSTVYMVANQNTGASKTLTTSRIVLRAICIA